MKERPILFSAPMVKAILANRKSQTRRIIDCPESTTSITWVENHAMSPSGTYTGWAVHCDAPLLLPRNCPYGKVGDRLWVRETWQQIYKTHGGKHEDWATVPTRQLSPHWQGTRLLYSATHAEDEPPKWRPSIHMPRWASRITLEVTGVRVEQVQSISADDAIAEGALPTAEIDPTKLDRSDWEQCKSTALACFQNIWHKINGPESWTNNEWVWVIGFKIVEARK